MARLYCRECGEANEECICAEIEAYSAEHGDFEEPE